MRGWIKRALVWSAILVWLPLAPCTRAAPPAITVYAAASLSDVLKTLGAAFTARTGTPVHYSFAASSALARQIEAGAPVDVFVSADVQWMDYLQQRQLIDAASRRNLISNNLVLIAPKASKSNLHIARGFPLADALGRGGRLAVADPAFVPAGRYAQVALENLGVWSALATRLAREENVRVALAFVARGETPFGIVYGSDARSDTSVRIVDVFPASSHPRIVYPAAVTAHAGPGARALLEFFSAAENVATFQQFGFVAL